MNFPVDGAHPVPSTVAEGSLIPCESLRCYTGGKEKPGTFSERQNWSLEEVETQSGIDFVTATPRARGKGQDSQSLLIIRENRIKKCADIQGTRTSLPVYPSSGSY